MSSGYQIARDGLFYLTFQRIGWVGIFTRKIYRNIRNYAGPEGVIDVISIDSEWNTIS